MKIFFSWIHQQSLTDSLMIIVGSNSRILFFFKVRLIGDFHHWRAISVLLCSWNLIRFLFLATQQNHRSVDQENDYPLEDSMVMSSSSWQPIYSKLNRNSAASSIDSGRSSATLYDSPKVSFLVSRKYLFDKTFSTWSGLELLNSFNETVWRFSLTKSSIGHKRAELISSAVD